MSNMFAYTPALAELKIGTWDVSNVTAMQYMFYSASALKHLDLSSWNTTKITDTGEMFSEMTSLESLDLSGWTVTNGVWTADMFTNSPNLWKLTYGSNFSWQTTRDFGLVIPTATSGFSGKWAIVNDGDWIGDSASDSYATGAAYSSAYGVDDLPSNPAQTTTVVWQKTERDINYEFNWNGDLKTAGRERPNAIIVKLYRNGKEIDEIQSSFDLGWSYTWLAQPVFDDNGDYINYSIRVFAADTNELLASSAVRGNENILSNTPVAPNIPENPATLDSTFVYILLGLSFAAASIFGYKRLLQRR